MAPGANDARPRVLDSAGARYFRARVWAWPDGALWRATMPLVAHTRDQRHRLFLDLVAPRPAETILDVGVTDSPERRANFLECEYPQRENITAVSVEPLQRFQLAFPEIEAVIADGRSLPFADRSFDIVYSNAVLEHVGTRYDQLLFLREICRVAGRAVFVATPSRAFPVDSHTLIPFAHWGPPSVRAAVYGPLGRGSWADIHKLNMLWASELEDLAGRATRAPCEVRRQRVAGLTSNLVLVAHLASRRWPLPNPR